MEIKAIKAVKRSDDLEKGVVSADEVDNSFCKSRL